MGLIRLFGASVGPTKPSFAALMIAHDALNLWRGLGFRLESSSSGSGHSEAEQRETRHARIKKTEACILHHAADSPSLRAEKVRARRALTPRIPKWSLSRLFVFLMLLHRRSVQSPLHKKTGTVAQKNYFCIFGFRSIKYKKSDPVYHSRPDRERKKKPGNRRFPAEIWNPGRPWPQRPAEDARRHHYWCEAASSRLN